MTLKEYVVAINTQYQTGVAGEHSYRPALQNLISSLLPGFVVTNEPARIDCGAPDFIISQGKTNIPVAFIEAKDVSDSDLDGRRQHKEQFNRYRQSLDRIVFTNYLDFHFYEYGQLIDAVHIADIDKGKIVLCQENEFKFNELIGHLVIGKIQPIISASKLALQMAKKTKLLADVIKKAFEDKNQNYENQQLQGEFMAFQNVLIHDLTPDAFADVLAQTIAYGMFAARLNDPTPENFSRQEAATLIPETNPFLRKIFQMIAGYDLDDRIAWIVDDLTQTFLATDTSRLIRNYGKNEAHTDPMIHFYEEFLSAYDPKLRKSKGVWYTPQPVVNFIVRAVDFILKKDFNLPLGLADYSKIEKESPIQQTYDGRRVDGMKHHIESFHRVQILDPATGTGTFLSEVVKLIYDTFKNQQGMWQSYVGDNLLPRLYGFELLMAPYTIAHLKLDMLLRQTGYTPEKSKRLKIYLTNSLEESSSLKGSLFEQWLSVEATEANFVKQNAPVMVMIGNPPYNVSSCNKGKWITQLTEDYKCNLNERNIQPLSDDYIKFIRFGQYQIEKNGSGILAFITNNTFIDGIIHRQMRKVLLETFDKIYILDMHGSSKRREICPDGSRDENIFDIKQGVSINIFVKTGEKKSNEFGDVFLKDLYGMRNRKYDFLVQENISSIAWTKVNSNAPYYFFANKDFSQKNDYNKGFKINDLFLTFATGIKTSKDDVVVKNSINAALQLKDDIVNLTVDTFRNKYNTGEDTADWSVKRAQDDIKTHCVSAFVTPYLYRPFDTKYIVYTGKTGGIIARPRFDVMKHFLFPNNLGFIIGRQGQAIGSAPWSLILVTDKMTDLNIFRRGGGCVFPLYISNDVDCSSDKKIVSNFNLKVLFEIENKLGDKIDAQQLFDYIYAVLHSPKYRKKYKAFLDVDFPRIPYPSDKVKYLQLVNYGTQLRLLHLMYDSPNWSLITNYPEMGNNIVDKIEYNKCDRVFINNNQYFSGVTNDVWNFNIGGYQPAQKWLKDRKGQILKFEDIRHYQELIVAISKTDCIMQEIDKIFN